MTENFPSLLLYGSAVLTGVLMWGGLQLAWPTSPAAVTRRKESRDRAMLLRDMPGALQSHDIFLVYQPKLRLRTGTIDGVEALLRWRHPVLGGISRGVLIPLVEGSGKIREFTIWVLRQVIADQARLEARGTRVAIYINVSGPLLTDGEFVREVSTLVGLAPGSIGFEITETSLISNPQAALVNLKRFVEQGIAISIDDYGSGVSSLAYLKELPASELKIDKLFISGMTASHRDPLIVRSTIDLAHALGMVVVAEGVESLAALALLRVMGCDFAQGYLISPALTIVALEQFLDDDHSTRLLEKAGATLQPAEAFWTRSGREAEQR